MFEGTLNKMITEKSDPINYFLKMDTGFIHMNQLIGKKISISYTGSRCLNCHKDIVLVRQGSSIVRGLRTDASADCGTR